MISPIQNVQNIVRCPRDSYTDRRYDMGMYVPSYQSHAPLKRGVEPSVELLQVGYGRVVCERIMLGATPG